MKEKSLMFVRKVWNLLLMLSLLTFRFFLFGFFFVVLAIVEVIVIFYILFFSEEKLKGEEKFYTISKADKIEFKKRFGEFKNECFYYLKDY